MSNGYFNPFLDPFADAEEEVRVPGSEPGHPGEPLLLPPPQQFSDAGSDTDASSVWSQPAYRPVAAQQPRVNTPHVVLPPFRAKRPAAWFLQCEDIFRMKGITDQRDMFALCYAMLGDEQLEQVDDLAETRPRPPDVFFRLRDRLVATHSLDAY